MTLSGALPLFVGLLTSTSDEVKEQAVRTWLRILLLSRAKVDISADLHRERETNWHLPK